MSLTLVVGASGAVGGAVVSELVQRGERVRAISSKAQPAAAGPVQWVRADVVGGEGLDAAFEGVTRAFVFSPPGHVNQHEINIPLIRRAQAARLDKLVLMTAMGANADPQAPLRLAELALEGAGLAYNIVRPNWFMQNFSAAWLPGILATGKIRLPAGDARTSFIDVRDVAAVAARLLTGHDVDNRAFDLTGPAALTHAEVAAELSKVAGRRVDYENVDPAELRTALVAGGAPAPYADFLVTILGFLAAGYNERTTSDVRDLLGREPTAFDRYARDHRQAWA